MDAITEIQSIIDENKEILTSKLYKELCDKTMKLKKEQENNYYNILVAIPTITPITSDKFRSDIKIFNQIVLLTRTQSIIIEAKIDEQGWSCFHFEDIDVSKETNYIISSNFYTDLDEDEELDELSEDDKILCYKNRLKYNSVNVSFEAYKKIIKITKC